MSLWVVTARNPRSGEATDWYFDNSTEAGMAHALALHTSGVAEIREDYVSSFDEFQRWITGEEL